ncbi:MAG: hypothetical protein LUE22_00760 [Oscillospiraceae bacterium]|nr:hypothetical protein [Oscillospiraceae bacterium]
MTYGELITRLCQLRDEMNRTEQGRTYLHSLKMDLIFQPEIFQKDRRNRNNGMEKREP